jgi:hypothetical protein
VLYKLFNVTTRGEDGPRAVVISGHPAQIPKAGVEPHPDVGVGNFVAPANDQVIAFANIERLLEAPDKKRKKDSAVA